MKNLFIAIAVFVCSLSLTANAAQGKHKLTAEKQALKQEILDKYDTNKDGKLDRKERANISKHDKQRIKKARLGHLRQSGNKETN